MEYLLEPVEVGIEITPDNVLGFKLGCDDLCKGNCNCGCC